MAESWVYMSPEAAEHCVSRKVSLVGIDYIAPEKPGGSLEDAPIHGTLLSNDIFILEGIALDNVPSGRYTLFCLPLKIKEAEASPVRAVLIG
jgi:arylformamidase